MDLLKDPILEIFGVLNMPLGKARRLTYETENGNLHSRFKKHLFPCQQNMHLTHFSIVKYRIFPDL